MTSTRHPTVTLSTLTFRRPSDIAATLPLLVEQAHSVPHDVEILVVDNDTVDSARSVVEGVAAEVRYVHEPSPGIAAARNRVLAETKGRDVVIFFDDDERPMQGWLHNLLDLYERERPTGVAGRVVSEYAEPPDAWIVAGRYFDRPSPATGARIPIAATNNLLLERRFLDEHGLRFDERFGLTGGSDTMLTQQITNAGGVLLWCEEAVVVDVVPASRLTREWVVLRAFRLANSGVRVQLELAASPGRKIAARFKAVAGGSTRLVVGAGQWLVGRATGSLAGRAQGIRKMARGRGMLACAFGYVYAEYSRSQGGQRSRWVPGRRA